MEEVAPTPTQITNHIPAAVESMIETVVVASAAPVPEVPDVAVPVVAVSTVHVLGEIDQSKIKLFDQAYDKIKSLITNKQYNSANWLGLLPMAMELVETVPTLSGADKKALVIDLLTKLVAELPMPEADRIMVQGIISTTIPAMIDLVISSSLGEIAVNLVDEVEHKVVTNGFKTEIYQTGAKQKGDNFGIMDIVSVCDRVREHGIESLTDDEQLHIFLMGQQVGLPFEEGNIQQYCDNVVEQFAIQLSKQQPPSSKKLYPKDCVIEDWDEYSDPKVNHNETCESDEDGLPIDPIMQTPIDSDKVVRLRCDKRLSCYDVDTLKHMVDTDPRDPTSRTKFSEELQRQIMRQYRSSHSSDSEQNGNEEGDLIISDALKQLEKLYANVEASIGYSENGQRKDSWQRRLNNAKDDFQAMLQNENIDPPTRVYLVFGDETEPGAAVLDEARLAADVLESTVV